MLLNVFLTALSLAAFCSSTGRYSQRAIQVQVDHTSSERENVSYYSYFGDTNYCGSSIIFEDINLTTMTESYDTLNHRWDYNFNRYYIYSSLTNGGGSSIGYIDWWLNTIDTSLKYHFNMRSHFDNVYNLTINTCFDVYSSSTKVLSYAFTMDLTESKWQDFTYYDDTGSELFVAGSTSDNSFNACFNLVSMDSEEYASKINANNLLEQYYDDGYYDGESTGYNNGYNDGYDVGYSAGTSADSTFITLFGAIADTPVLMVRSLFDFDFFGVNLLGVVLSLFTALILFFIARKLL